jgi:hypothetical protein
MLYQAEVLDRQTGELVSICKGEWITVTELGRAFGLGSRQVRQVLYHLGWVFPTAGGRGRYCLTPDAIRRGLGNSIPKSKSGRPFDVISPLGQEKFANEIQDALRAISDKETVDVVKARRALETFKAARLDRNAWNTRMEVSWVSAFWPALSQDEIAAALNISKQLVSYHLERQRREREETIEQMQAALAAP